MTWDPCLETGDGHVDGEHRRMHDMLRELEEAGRSSRSDALIRDMLERLTEHAVVHFAHEESLMDQCGYDRRALDHHVDQHRQLTYEIRELVLRYRAGGIEDLGPVVDFLRRWLNDHIMRVDKPLIDFVRSLGEDGSDEGAGPREAG